jgi:dienelactone hydrolase
MRQIILTLAALAVPLTAAAQQLPSFKYPEPPASSYRALTNVPVRTSDTDPLHMDIYRPASGGRAPTLIFFNRASGEGRANSFYVAWARIAASQGVTAIVPDLRAATIVQDFVALIEYLNRGPGEETGIDPDAVAVYAGSGNVLNALPIVQDHRSTRIKSAVMYYGAADVASFRPDLPVLFVRAGLDRPPLNRHIDSLVARALSENAPITVLNHAGGRHGFEMSNDDDATKRVIDESIAFVKETTSTRYQAALRAGLAEATAAGHVTAGRTKEAVGAYAGLVKDRAGDASLRLAYGEALLSNGDFAAACAEFEGLKGKGLGYRDLGLPAARACLQKGDPEAAIAWLKSIPQRFLPADVQNEPVFAPLRERADFRALFVSRLP